MTVYLFSAPDDSGKSMIIANYIPFYVLIENE